MKLTLALVLLALALAGCGGGDEPPPPAADPTTAPADTGPTGAGAVASDVPGGPDPGEPIYTALGTYWSELPMDERIASAAEFIADNGEACAGIAAEDLSRQAGVAYGIDFTLTTPVGDVMLETCALLRDGE